jgi:uncharacterized protein YcbK (DUF882 family)
MAAAMAALGSCLASAPALAETRSLKLYHLHTHEKAEIVYKRNGRYDKAGLKKINYILRDWRRNEPTTMDPRLLDLVWQAYRQTGSSAYIQIVSGYRAPQTNSMLRSRSKGVAEKSQHMAGKAMDFYIPGVPLRKLRDIGLKLQGGGVGYYPTSGSPFVHMDVANVRHWPGISRQELARVFPTGKTLHVPSDGKPLPGYEHALAAYQARKESGTPNIELASVDTRKSGRGLLAALFGSGGADEADDMADVAATPGTKATEPSAKASTPSLKIAIVAPQDAQRADIASQEVRQPPTPETVVASLSASQVPVPAFAERATAEPVFTDLAVIPLPQWRPDREPAPDTGAILVASIEPQTASVPITASRRSGKADRVVADADRSRPNAAAIAAQMHSRDWPYRLEPGPSGGDGAVTTAQLATNFIRSRPLAVYVGGFRTDRQQNSHRRFSGSAVNFLPLARFE